MEDSDVNQRTQDKIKAMHESNREWWSGKSIAYPQCFSGDIKIVEFGSLYENGSVRDYFSVPPGNYIGIDWRGGRNVDIVSLAHEVPIDDAQIDTVISASMLEHDPYWDRSLAKMVKILKPDGSMFVTWAAGSSGPHRLKADPSGNNGYYPLKVGDVLRLLGDLGVGVQSFEYENIDMGFAALHAWRDAARVVDPHIDELLEVDKI